MTTKSKQKKLASSGEISDKLYEDQVREQAQKLMPAAVGVLSELAAGTDTPHAVKRQAANDIISHGHVRPKSDKVAALAALGGGTINVIMGNFIEAGAKPGKVEKVIETRVVSTEPMPDIEDMVIDEEPVPEHERDPLLEVIMVPPR